MTVRRHTRAAIAMCRYSGADDAGPWSPRRALAFRAAGDCDAARTECSQSRTSVSPSPVQQVPGARVSAGEIEGCPGLEDRDW
jgi:hypothetical protein